MLYAVSLFLPACEPTKGDSHHAFGNCWLGWEVLQLLVIPFFWLFGLPLVYLLVNVAFWCSLFFVRFRIDVNATFDIHAAYTMLLGICTALAWVAGAIVETICIGYFLWSLSYTVMVIGFLISRLFSAPKNVVITTATDV